MTNVYQILLAVIGILSGAWLGFDLLKRKARQTTRPAPTPRKSAAAGAKGGAMTRPWPRQTVPFVKPAPAEGRRDRAPEASSPEDPTETKSVSNPESRDEYRSMDNVHGPLDYVKELVKRFTADQCPAWAAALSFFVLLSVIPLLLVGLAAAGALMDPATATQRVEGFLASLVPGPTASQTARDLIEGVDLQERAAELRHASGVTGWIGAALLLWAATRIYANAAIPMNAAFRAKETRGFLVLQIGMPLFLLLAAGLLFLLSFIPSAGAQIVNRLLGLSLPTDPTPLLLTVALFVLAVFFNAGMYTITYRWLPSPTAGVQWRDAAVGGVIVAVLWEAAKQGFGYYLRSLGGGEGYARTYGALAGPFLVVLWVYYSSMILLLGAEIVEMYRESREKKAKAAAGEA